MVDGIKKEAEARKIINFRHWYKFYVAGKKNMGAWSFMLQNFTAVPLSVIARSTSASPASGSSELHKLRQDAILDEVFAHAIG